MSFSALFFCFLSVIIIKTIKGQRKEEEKEKLQPIIRHKSPTIRGLKLGYPLDKLNWPNWLFGCKPWKFQPKHTQKVKWVHWVFQTGNQVWDPLMLKTKMMVRRIASQEARYGSPSKGISKCRRMNEFLDVEASWSREIYRFVSAGCVEHCILFKREIDYWWQCSFGRASCIASPLAQNRNEDRHTKQNARNEPMIQ